MYIVECGLSGPGAAEPTQSEHGGEGLCTSMPGLHLQVHLRQLPRLLQPASRSGERGVSISVAMTTSMTPQQRHP